MKKLHQLAKELHANNYVMTDKMKEQFEDFLSIIAEDARILHPRFGLGTVLRTQGNSWVVVEFDRDIDNWKEQNNINAQKAREYIAKGQLIPWHLKGNTERPSKSVMISSCTSIHMLIKREKEREIRNDFDI